MGSSVQNSDTFVPIADENVQNIDENVQILDSIPNSTIVYIFHFVQSEEDWTAGQQEKKNIFLLRKIITKGAFAW